MQLQGATAAACRLPSQLHLQQWCLAALKACHQSLPGSFSKQSTSSSSCVMQQLLMSQVLQTQLSVPATSAAAMLAAVQQAKPRVLATTKQPCTQLQQWSARVEVAIYWQT
jgi:hypothetical protein